jgi:catechol 2,3-dioxygenase-like lactoylglutathione lyase family enzyme
MTRPNPHPDGDLLAGFDHVATLTSDTDRLHRFYREVFGATVEADEPAAPGMRMSIIAIGPRAHLNVFQIDGNAEASTHREMFGRGRIDHLGLQASSDEAFDEIRRRLVDHGATDGFVTDFGPVLSVWFVDPDGLEGEVCVPNRDAVPGRLNPPGTPSARYHHATQG